MLIPFTQFHLPNGRKTVEHFDATSFPDEVKQKAQYLLGYGCRFEIELLRTGLVHADCSFSDEGPLANFVCPNDAQLVEQVRILIERSYEALTALLPQET